jgi:LacI family transcriptional regulator
VAAAAGVSTATVSRTLNSPDTVSQRLRHQVSRAVEALGYVPHGAARALASQRTHTVGAIIPTMTHAIFGRFVDELEDVLYEAGYALLLASSHYRGEREVRQAQNLVSRGIDAMVLVGENHPEGVYRCLGEGEIPYVTTWIYRNDGTLPCVGFDNRASAARVATYLYDIGHRHFAMISAVTQGNDRAAERLLGVQEALAQRGIDLPPSRVVECSYDIDEGRRALRTMMSQSSPPTAIICSNDVLAFGALFESRTLGLDVPRHLSITGFDDLELAAEVSPPLTTMRVPADKMARLASQYLIGRMTGGPATPQVQVEVNLIVRGTTAPPPLRPPRD